MINVVKYYDNSYSYGMAERKRQRNNIIRAKLVVGSILTVLSIFMFFYTKVDCNGWIAIICLIISIALLIDIR